MFPLGLGGFGDFPVSPLKNRAFCHRITNVSSKMKVGHVGNVLHSFLALSPILHNELISTKREIFAPRGPGVDAEYRNKRALIEVFERVSIRYVRSISTASIPQK